MLQTSGPAVQWFDLETEPCLPESDVPSASVCKEHELSQVPRSPGCAEVAPLTDDHPFGRAIHA